MMAFLHRGLNLTPLSDTLGHIVEKSLSSLSYLRILTSSDSFWSIIQPPEDISTTGKLIDYLFDFTTYLNVFYFILLCIGLFGFSFYYYYKRHPKAYYTYGNK